MKWYGTDYLPLWKNDSVAYFEEDVETLIANEGKTWVALPQKIEYTLPQDRLEIYAPIDWNIQYLKLEVEDERNTVMYFYRNDMSEVLGVRKATGVLDMTWTFTLDYYYTYFRDMFNVLKEVNPDIYFIRKFADRFDSSFSTNLHERWWFKNQLPIQLNPDYRTNIEVSSLDIMQMNNISNFIANNATLNSSVTNIKDLSDLVAGDSFNSITLNESPQYLGGYDDNDKVKVWFRVSDTAILMVHTSYTNWGFEVEGDDASIPGLSVATYARNGNLEWANSQTTNYGVWDKNTRTFKFFTDQAVSQVTQDGDGPWWNGAIMVCSVPTDVTYQASFWDQSIGHKFRYAVVKKDCFTSSALKTFFQLNGVDLVLIPIPVKDYEVKNLSTGITSTINIDDFNTVFYNYSSTSNEEFIWSEGNVLATFESPLPFDLFAKSNNIYWTQITATPPGEGSKTAYLFFYPLTNLSTDSYIELLFYNMDGYSSLESWNRWNEPYLMFNNQFRRYDVALERGIEVPMYNYEWTPSSTPIQAYIMVNNDMKLGLNPAGFSEGSPIYQDRFQYQSKISNNIIKDTSAYNNWLVNNIQTEQTARANLQDEQTIMNRNNALTGTQGVFNAISGGIGAFANALKGNYGTAIGDLAQTGFGIGQTYNTIANRQTEFGIKQRNLNTQFANIRKSPASITNQDADKQMIPFTNDGINIIRTELTDEQKEVVMQEIYNYGYAYGGVDAFSSYDNRSLFNVIQVDTEYNREQLEQIIKSESNVEREIWYFNVGDKITQIRFSNDFIPTPGHTLITFENGHDMIKDVIPGISFDNGLTYRGDKISNWIWKDGSFHSSWTNTDGTTWNKDTLTLTFPEEYVVKLNNFKKDDYDGKFFSYIKIKYDGVFKYQSAIWAFLDWLGSIHRFYKTNDFNVNKSANLESFLAFIYKLLGDYSDWNITIHEHNYPLEGNFNSWNITIHKYDYDLVGNFNNWLIEIQYHNYPLEGNFNSWLIEIETHNYNLVGNFSSWTITKHMIELENIVIGDKANWLFFSTDFEMKVMYESWNLQWSDGSEILINYPSSSGWNISYSGQSIATNGEFASSWSLANGTSWDLDTLTLTFSSLVSLTHKQGWAGDDYTGHAYVVSYIDSI